MVIHDQDQDQIEEDLDQDLQEEGIKDE